MSYRKDYLHRDARPPPPYSKHKPATSSASSNSCTSSPLNEPKFSAELFRDMSKKIAQLTKVICNLTNKTEDQDLAIQSMKTEHQQQLQTVQSEAKIKIDAYKAKIDTLELNLLEERRQKTQTEEEFLILKQFCSISENCKTLKNNLKSIAKEKNQLDSKLVANDRSPSSDTEHPVSVYLNKRIDLQNSSSKNGCSNTTFISHKLKNVEEYQNEIRTLINDCERLNEEKKELQTKYETEITAIKSQLPKVEEKKLTSSATKQCQVEDEEMKEKLQKQEVQYRKRIGELLEHLTQSETRAEKHMKEIKKLELLVSSKEKQISAAKEEISKTAELLKISRNETKQIQELYSKQTEEIQGWKDRVGELENQMKICSTDLLNSKSESKKLSSQMQKYEQWAEKLSLLLDKNLITASENVDTQTKVVKESCLTVKSEDDFEMKLKNLLQKHAEEKQKMKDSFEKETNSLTTSFKAREKELLDQIEQTKQDYEVHMEQERYVHSEIQDNLEQQLDLLHSNLQQMVRNESAEMNSLQTLVEEKDAILEKTKDELNCMRMFAKDLMQKLQKKEASFAELKENLKITQKLNLVEKLQGAMAKCLQNKDSLVFHGESKHFLLKPQDDGRSTHEGSLKQEYLMKRIEVLDHTNQSLLKERENLKQTHRAELDAQSEAHKIDLQRLRQEYEASFKEEIQKIRRHYEERLAFKKEDKSPGLLRKAELEKYELAQKEKERLEQKLKELHQEIAEKEEATKMMKEQLLSDVILKQNEIEKQTGIIEKLKKEKEIILTEKEKQAIETARARQEISQQIRNLESYWQERLIRELKKASRTCEQEKQKLLMHFNKGQRLLKDKINLLQSIIQNLKQQSIKQQNLENEEMKELRSIITEKDSEIRKLKREREVMRSEFIKPCCSKMNTSQTSLNSIDTVLSLKKPLFERPPLTPQLVRRHSLVTHPEQKWIRARSQSPLHGVLYETSTKSSLSKASGHRSSWTGESLEEIFNSAFHAIQNESRVLNFDSDSCDSSVETSAVPENSKSIPSEGVTEDENIVKNQDLKTPEEQTNNYLCGTITECDESHTPTEENKK